MHDTTTQHPTTNPDPLLSRSEAARYLGTSTVTLDRLARAGDLNPTRVGARPRYRVSELERYLTEEERR